MQTFDVELPLTGAGGPTLSEGMQYKISGGGLPNRLTIADIYAIDCSGMDFGGIIFDPNGSFFWIAMWAGGTISPAQYRLSDGAATGLIATGVTTMGVAVFDTNVWYGADYTNARILELDWSGNILRTVDTSPQTINPMCVCRVPGAGQKVWAASYPGSPLTEYDLTTGLATGRTVGTGISTCFARAGFIYGCDQSQIYKWDEPTLTLQTTWSPATDTSAYLGHIYPGYIQLAYVDSSDRPICYDGLSYSVDRFEAIGGNNVPADRRLVYAQPQINGGAGMARPGGPSFSMLGEYVKWAAYTTGPYLDQVSGHFTAIIRNMFTPQRARWAWTNPTSQTATVTRISVPGSHCNDFGAAFDLRKTRFFYSTNGGVTRTEFDQGSTLAISLAPGSTVTFDVDITDGDGQATNAPFVGGNAGEGPHLIYTIPTGGAGIPMTNFTPAPGTPLSPQQAVQFDVTDTTSPFREVFIVASFDGVQRELVYDADGFNPAHYAGGANTKTTITNGFRFTLLRDGGWFGSLNIKVYAIDEGGGENP